MLGEIIDVLFACGKMFLDILIAVYPLVQKIQNLPYEFLGCAIGISPLVVTLVVKILQRLERKLKQ